MKTSFPMQKITPFLWFDDRAREAARFYVSIFKNSKILGDDGADGAGAADASVSSARFQLDGQELIAFNGGPHFKFTEAISLFVNCETQDEVDDLWERLSEGGETSRCGWLKDKFGVSWQIVPSVLGEMLSDPDDEKSERAMNAMLGMTKIDIAGLQRAVEGG
jgi:predicted 3-demethylubiquinone-9 3-methyltransferase (glyoxalase superfamily)